MASARSPSAPAACGRCCQKAGRDIADLHVGVSLRDPDPDDVSTLAEAGIDELVIVELPPGDPHEAARW